MADNQTASDGASNAGRKKRNSKRNKRGKTDPVGGHTKDISQSVDDDLHKASTFDPSLAGGDASAATSTKGTLESVQPLIPGNDMTELQGNSDLRPGEDLSDEDAGALVIDEDADNNMIDKDAKGDVGAMVSAGSCKDGDHLGEKESAVEGVHPTVAVDEDVKGDAKEENTALVNDKQSSDAVHVPSMVDEGSELPVPEIASSDVKSPTGNNTSDLEDPTELYSTMEKLLKDAGVTEGTPEPTTMSDRISANLLEEAGVLTEEASAESMLASPKGKEPVQKIEPAQQLEPVQKMEPVQKIDFKSQSSMAEQGVIFDKSIEVDVTQIGKPTEQHPKASDMPGEAQEEPNLMSPQQPVLDSTSSSSNIPEDGTAMMPAVIDHMVLKNEGGDPECVLTTSNDATEKNDEKSPLLTQNHSGEFPQEVIGETDQEKLIQPGDMNDVDDVAFKPDEDKGKPDKTTISASEEAPLLAEDGKTSGEGQIEIPHGCCAGCVIV